MAYNFPSDAVPYQERGPFAKLRVEVPVSYDARAHVFLEAKACGDEHLKSRGED
jgi:hypothetical protein